MKRVYRRNCKWGDRSSVLHCYFGQQLQHTLRLLKCTYWHLRTLEYLKNPPLHQVSNNAILFLQIFQQR